EGYGIELFGKQGLVIEAVTSSSLILSESGEKVLTLEISEKETCGVVLNGVESIFEVTYVSTSLNDAGKVVHQIRIKLKTELYESEQEAEIEEGSTISWGFTPSVDIIVKVGFEKEEGTGDPSNRLEVKLEYIKKWTKLEQGEPNCGGEEVYGLCLGNLYIFSYDLDSDGLSSGFTLVKILDEKPQ
ncbi:hypothetical protein HYT84_04470, partial [Candidatus Micrarchaeota archaeon]|nr:hypothetical protein [Candidatus Micrarchaeota archaeon]